ncbi:hypothetical protein [Bacillus sp. ISL-57]|uniref:hypothetical protein n=1 Tax=Bacillus sp. ISL-57 TaxID=2819135 RepID=UPI001BECF53F|nr:hypothetical protein [Bacillus sp. ISL-57]MBT2719067.1 hypothetical protein [Bacillus sp. ISL-57]
MDILLRNIDPVAMKKIDVMAKRKSVSRQEFLKSIVEKVAYEPEINENELRLESIIKMHFQIMKEATITINRFENLLVELMEE